MYCDELTLLQGRRVDQLVVFIFVSCSLVVGHDSSSEGLDKPG